MSPHTISLVVRFADCDQFQHVNNSKYLTYVEQSRIAFMDDILGEEINWKEKGFILARIETNFIKPILHKDTIYVASACTELGNKSIRVAYQIYLKDEKGIRIDLAEGISVLVAYNYIEKCAMTVPNEWREKLEAFEGKRF